MNTPDPRKLILACAAGPDPSADPSDVNRPCMADAEDGEQPWDGAPFLFADPPDPADEEPSATPSTGAEAA